jgi:hypothetical protein
MADSCPIALPFRSACKGLHNRTEGPQDEGTVWTTKTEAESRRRGGGNDENHEREDATNIS